MINKKFHILIGLLLTNLLFSCVSGPTKNPFVGEQPQNRVSIMAFNVENLFDIEHDKGKEDYTYLPLRIKKKDQEVQDFCSKQKKKYQKECFELNWNEKTLAAKFDKLTNSVLQIYSKGPDILMVEEVENLKVLKEWNEAGLKVAGYKTIELIEGPDTRGIDVGLFSRFEKAGPSKLHEINWKKVGEDPDSDIFPTRGILEVPLYLPNKQIIHVFVVHFPSQANPTIYREDSVQTIIELVSKVPKDRYWVVGGDWNITYDEDQKSGLVSKDLASVGLVSHIVGCKKCKGTHNYRKDWSFLDILVFSKNFSEASSNWKLVPDSIEVPRWGEDQAYRSGRPKRFNAEQLTGVSDHFPIYGEIELAPATTKQGAN